MTNKKLLLIFLVLLFTNASFAQSKIMEGKITYSISMPEGKKGDDNLLAKVMGKEQVIYFKGKQSRIETQTQMGEVVVLNQGDGSMYTLLNLMGKKIAMKTDEGDMDMLKEMVGADAEKLKKPEVTITKETKKIAGFKCKKALVIYPEVKGEKMEGEVWFTDDVAFSGPKEFSIKEIEGFPMEFSYAAKGTRIKMTCTKVESMLVKDEQFKVPEDYTVQTMMDMMSGGGLQIR